MRALVLCGETWNPAEVIRGGLSGLGRQGFGFEFPAEGRQWSPALLQAYQLVVVAKANQVSSTDGRQWLTQEIQGAFSKLGQVRRRSLDIA